MEGSKAANSDPGETSRHGVRLMAYLRLLRPQQWTKNLLVLAALLFAGQIQVPHQVFRAFLAFFAFCLASSAVYIINDIMDRDADRAHPRKNKRPIAAGIIRPESGIWMALFCLAGAVTLIWITTRPALLCLIAYFLLQAGYVTVFRHRVLLDVFAVAAGFILRAVTGAYAIEVIISPWLLICTLQLSLFLALSKRRSELLVSDNPGIHRQVLAEYNLGLLDQLITVVTSCTVLAYILYTFSEQTSKKFHSELMPLTIPFVLYGIFRYLYLIHKKSGGGEPEMLLLKDIPLLAGIVLWAATVAIITHL